MSKMIEFDGAFGPAFLGQTGARFRPIGERAAAQGAPAIRRAHQVSAAEAAIRRATQALQAVLAEQL